MSRSLETCSYLQHEIEQNQAHLAMPGIANMTIGFLHNHGWSRKVTEVNKRRGVRYIKGLHCVFTHLDRALLRHAEKREEKTWKYLNLKWNQKQKAYWG